MSEEILREHEVVGNVADCREAVEWVIVEGKITARLPPAGTGSSRVTEKVYVELA